VSIYKHDPDDPTSISDDSVLSLRRDDDGTLWAGTFNHGLNRFDPQTERFVHYTSDPTDPDSLADETILALHEDRQGALWIGTHSGLDRLDRSSGAITHYTTDDGLPNGVIYGILEDDQGNLWLSTNGGLSRFDPRTETFKNFTVRDGLQSNEFNQGAYFRSSSGEMFFGGISGFNAFYPEQIEDNTYVPPVVLTSLTQGGEAMAQAVESLTEVTLNWPNNFFEFEFAALSFAQPEENQYAYWLEGFEEDWNYIGTRRFGRYTNIPGGTYTLHIKGSNNDGVWNEEGTSLTITVVPPIWQRWWFQAILATFGAGVVLTTFNLRLRSIERQRRQLEAQVNQRTKELRETLSELKQSKEAAEAASRAKSAFLANMSHELRTPLNAILGFTQLMSSDPNLTHQQRENLATINHSGEHLLGLINDVLELSKIEAGRMTLKQQDVDLHNLLDGLEEMFLLRAKSKGLNLIFERDPDVPRHIRTDVGKLRQILMNLLGNGVKFTQKGHVVLRVWVASPNGGSNGQVRLGFEVRDTGPGISPEDLEVVFAPFEQTAIGRQSQEGTGLGLPLSQQYVRLMGGNLTATSPLAEATAQGGPGSAFRFDIPVTLTEPPSEEAAGPARRVVGLEPGQPRYRLLIAEDDRANRRLLVQLLTPLGFEVREALTGQEALEVWESWEPHLIFMDMRMPVMDGYEATRRIKATSKGQDTVIIALTASALEEDRATILAGGCDSFIRKPFRQSELFDALTRHLGVRFLYQEEPPSAVSPRMTASETGPELTTAMSALPPDLLHGLEKATTRGDLTMIAHLIDRIRQHDQVLAGVLDEWAQAFNHDAILRLIASTKETSSPTGGQA
jgi:signal transduction histidine kinase/CheY-like chemotaxis protein